MHRFPKLRVFLDIKQIMRLFLSLTFLLLISLPVQAGMKFYSRLGDLPETAEIYRMVDSDEVIFVDAGSLPSSHRARITKNPEVFKRVDMSKVKQGKSVTSKGAVTYTKVWYATEKADLYELKSKGVFLNLDTVPESAKTKIKSKPDVFVHVGKPIEIKEEKIKEVEDKISKLLTSIVIGKDLDLEKYGTKGVAKAFAKYQQAIDEVKGPVIKEIEGEINKLIEKGDIGGVKKLTSNKVSFLESGDTSSLEEIDDYGIKRAVTKYKKNQRKEQNKLNIEIDKGVKSLMRKGNLELAEKIASFKEESSTDIEKSKSSSTKKKYTRPAKKIKIDVNFLVSNKWILHSGGKYRAPTKFNEDGTFFETTTKGKWRGTYKLENGELTLKAWSKGSPFKYNYKTNRWETPWPDGRTGYCEMAK